jgi:hypothetical protein
MEVLSRSGTPSPSCYTDYKESSTSDSKFSKLNITLYGSVRDDPQSGNGGAACLCADQEVKQMYDRLLAVRRGLLDRLAKLGTPGKWNAIAKGSGMFW